MKNKGFLFLLLLLLALPAGAQGWTAGGTVSFNRSFSNNTSGISLRPDFSYSFGKLSVGMNFNIEFYWNRGTVENHILGAGPYVQYSFWSKGAVSLFVEAGIPVSHNRFYSDGSFYYQLTPYLSPGMEISFSDHWSLIGYLGRIEYDTYQKNLSFLSDPGNFTLGLYYSF